MNGLAPRGDARGQARERGGSRPEDVRVKVVRVDDIYLVLAQVSSEASKLGERVAVVKAVQGVGRNLFEAQARHLFAQHALAVQTRDVHVVTSALAEQAHDLHGLALRAALVEAVYQM